MTKKLQIDEIGAKMEIVSTLLQGGVVILPTDTLYGFSASISSESGIQRIASIKGNGEERRFLFLAGGVRMVEEYINSWGCADRDLLDEIWPAPFTAIFTSGKNCPVWVGETIALRVPVFKPLQDIIETLGEPIVSTSVNRSGEPPLRHIADIEKEFSGRVDLIVSGKSPLENLSSTIVDFTGDVPVLVRQGSYRWELEEENTTDGESL